MTIQPSSLVRLSLSVALQTRRVMSILLEQTATAPLGDRLHDACNVTTEFLSDIVRETCRRFSAVHSNAGTSRIERLIQSQAWTDAALALIDLELPPWQVRRLVWDDGEWHCALSRRRELPDWLDQPIETRHADLALAIMGAFVEAQLAVEPTSRTSVPVVMPNGNSACEPICADNFA